MDVNSTHDRSYDASTLQVMQHDPNSLVKIRERRSTIACTNCRAKKKKCKQEDGRDDCNTCLAKNKTCVYLPVPSSSQPSPSQLSPVDTTPSPSPSPTFSVESYADADTRYIANLPVPRTCVGQPDQAGPSNLVTDRESFDPPFATTQHFNQAQFQTNNTPFVSPPVASNIDAYNNTSFVSPPVANNIDAYNNTAPYDYGIYGNRHNNSARESNQYGHFMDGNTQSAIANGEIGENVNEFQRPWPYGR